MFFENLKKGPWKLKKFGWRFHRTQII